MVRGSKDETGCRHLGWEVARMVSAGERDREAEVCGGRKEAYDKGACVRLVTWFGAESLEWTASWQKHGPGHGR